MKGLFRKYCFTEDQKRGYVSVLSPSDGKVILMFNQPRTEQSFEGAFPTVSLSERTFLTRTDNVANSAAARRFFLVPVQTELCAKTEGKVYIYKTDHQDYVILDTIDVKDEVFVLRWNNVYTVVNLSLDCCQEFSTPDEYDAFMSLDELLEYSGSYPEMFYDVNNHEYQFHEGAWKAVSLLPER